MDDPNNTYDIPFEEDNKQSTNLASNMTSVKFESVHGGVPATSKSSIVDGDRKSEFEMRIVSVKGNTSHDDIRRSTQKGTSTLKRKPTNHSE